jgi:hypothetical protein
MKNAVILIALLMMPAVSIVMAAEQGRQISWEGFTLIVPERWNIPKDQQPEGRRDAKEKIVVMTKDGLLLDKIEFRKRLITAELGHTRKRMARGMMPQELAEAVQNDLELNQSLKNFKLIENRPATVNGSPGFRLVFSFRNNGTLQYQCVYYGFAKEDLFYSILFTAPKRHYFDANAGTFEQIIKSLKLDEQSGGAGSGEGI